MNKLEQQIVEEVRLNGAISFAGFMERALYCPELGYYERKENTPGQRGDYYTGVSVGPLFGQLLGFLFDTWAAEAGGKAFDVVEGGGHDGRLASDILDWVVQRRPGFAARLRYWILEPSERRRGWQGAMLAAHGGCVRWLSGWEAAAEVGGFSGVIFCNELLDAFPVHRLGWDAARRGWFEWGVDVGLEGRLCWVRLSKREVERHALPEVPEALARVLPEGFTVEVSPQAVGWWRQGARLLRGGRMLAFDYGLEGAAWLAPERAQGTLRGYRRHQLQSNPLEDAGDQDLTAHVNWTQLMKAGEEEGLRTEELVEQGRFLTRLGARVWGEGSEFGVWEPEMTRQFQTLAHPSHLGMKFQVMVQRK